MCRVAIHIGLVFICVESLVIIWIIRRQSLGLQARDEVGTLAPGGIADIVLWRASDFGVKPLMVLKGGIVAWGAIGEGNASVHGAEPTRLGPDWGGTGDAGSQLAVTFVSRAAVQAGLGDAISTRRRLAVVANTRGLTRVDLVANTVAPPIEVSPLDGTVTLLGRIVTSDPVAEVPLSRR